MEAAGINSPPPWLERTVLCAIPPAARDAVAGDLWETYRSPRQYAAEALRTVPFVVASQMRRNLNLPVLMLQGALLFIFLGAPFTMILLPALMLRAAYQATTRPCPRRVMQEAILLSSGVMILLFLIMSIRFPLAARSSMDHFNWLSLFMLGMLLAPLLCIFRAGLILQSDRCTQPRSSALRIEDLASGYRDFLRGILRRNLLEGLALMAVAIGGFFLAWNPLLLGMFLLTAFYLLLEATPRAIPVADDFVSLRAHYQQELARQQQLRRFLRWLWFSPVLVMLHARLTEHGLAAAGRPITALLDWVGAAILCFLVAALNREHGGRVWEQIESLDRVRERPAQQPS